MKKASLDALEAAAAVSRRLGGRPKAPIRRSLIERPAEDQLSPLTLLLRGGRGGTVRLKLELSFLWFAAKAPHSLIYPARAWANLVGLEDADGRGARRVNEAILWLERNKFITVRAQPGQPNVVTLLQEDATNQPYELPGGAYNRLRKTPDQADQHRYIQLPAELWTKGWLSILSGAALAMLLVLYAEVGNNDPSTTDVWFSPSRADLRYGLSEDTRSKGLRELQAAGLIDVRRAAISPDTFDFRRLRNVYRLDPDHFDAPAKIREASDPPLATRVFTPIPSQL